MALFNKLPNHIRYSSAREWQLLKKVPMAILLGTVTILIPALLLRWESGLWFPLESRMGMLILGVLFTFLFFVGLMSIGLVVMIVMKGPGYVADAYQLPKEDPSLEGKKHSHRE